MTTSSSHLRSECKWLGTPRSESVKLRQCGTIMRVWNCSKGMDAIPFITSLRLAKRAERVGKTPCEYCNLYETKDDHK